MKKEGFTLVELLAVIIILAVILAIAVPGISGLIDSVRKNAFEDDVKMLIKAIDYKKLENDNFDVASVTEDNLNSTLGLSDTNYSDVVIKIIDGEINAEVIGSGKWDSYVACGTYKNMEVDKDSSCTNTNPNASFAYTGSVQTYVIPESGYYKLQVWGASAGDNTNLNMIGGKGSYAEGEKYFDAGTTIYIQIGGRGTDVAVADDTSDFLTSGGYNGGGDGAGAGPSGGGATDIRMVAGSWDDTSSLNSRVIVAGGGGGNIGYMPSDGVTNYNGRAITSDYLYQLGIGQDGDLTRHSASYPNDEPGAGGGYYGGTNMHGNWGAYGYGGSSYITGLLNEKVIDGASSMLTPIGNAETGHSGNGYAIITFMSTQFEDKIPPSIVIGGDDVLVLEPGESYTDQGATATDNIDGDMTSDITTVSTVDPNNPGEYDVTYTATDDGGKTSSKSRTVVVNYPPNAPVLAANMIPVMWSGTNWVKADSTNSNATYKWYNYSQKTWANAVTVTEATRNSYLSAAIGSVVSESDVLTYLVWIPKYKYSIPSGTGVKSIAIAWQPKTATESSGTAIGGSFYTHPAFTFGNAKLSGIWVGKFESSSNTPGATDGGGNTSSLNVLIKPNVVSWRGVQIVNSFPAVRNMQATGNIYGFSTTGLDTHMMKNSEWGAVAYLAQSRYGKNGELWLNPNRNFITGCAASNSTTEYTTVCNTYETAYGINTSTTGNVYGIYDMSGGAYEYVMGNYDHYTGYPSCNSGYNGHGYDDYGPWDVVIDITTGVPFPDSKYYDLYTSNEYKKGDATVETKGWYADEAEPADEYWPWYVRGGYYRRYSTGLFAYGYDAGVNSYLISFRVVLETEY